MKRLVWMLLLIALWIGSPAAALAGPVHWIEVSPTAAGRQWWDEGSLRLKTSGTISVLSRFQPATPESEPAAKPKILGDLYVMEIDCGETLYRDTSVNGLPRWGAEWQPVGGDGLIQAVVEASCSAAGLLPS